MSRIAQPLLFALAVTSCATARPRVANLASEWERVRDDGDGVTFHHPCGGTIATSTTCGDADDVPLDVLTNHALIGVEQRREQPRRRLVVDGRAALRTRLDATLDGVPVALDLVVLKKDGCTIDLYLVAPPRAFDERRPDFDRFVAAFRQAERR
ncbi:MAG: hypothetical protein ACXVAN_00215 [Polyangia bacterium]